MNTLMNRKFELLNLLYTKKDDENISRLSQGEMAEILGLSRGTVNRLLQELMNDELIRKNENYNTQYIVTPKAIKRIHDMNGTTPSIHEFFANEAEIYGNSQLFSADAIDWITKNLHVTSVRRDTFGDVTVRRSLFILQELCATFNFRFDDHAYLFVNDETGDEYMTFSPYGIPQEKHQSVLSIFQNFLQLAEHKATDEYLGDVAELSPLTHVTILPYGLYNPEQTILIVIPAAVLYQFFKVHVSRLISMVVDLLPKNVSNDNPVMRECMLLYAFSGENAAIGYINKENVKYVIDDMNEEFAKDQLAKAEVQQIIAKDILNKKNKSTV